MLLVLGGDRVLTSEELDSIIVLVFGGDRV